MAWMPDRPCPRAPNAVANGNAIVSPHFRVPLLEPPCLPLRLGAVAAGSAWLGSARLDSAPVTPQLRNWADLMLVAPLSANTLAKLANGLCDNLVVRAVPSDAFAWLVQLSVLLAVGRTAAPVGAVSASLVSAGVQAKMSAAS